MIKYQNEIGNVMVGRSSIELPGFAGQRHTNVTLKFKTEMSTKGETGRTIMSVVNDKGIHVSSYPISNRKYRKIIKDGFWIWQDRNFN